MGVAPMLGSPAVKVHLRRLTRPQTLDKEIPASTHQAV
ncbi:hypothetical protein ACVWYZ_000876 [Thermostichus sp. MS-CIW-37]